jgi:transcriptional regulator with XRE-family HTH domain
MISPNMMREARIKKGITQTAVAVAVGVSINAVRLWEAGGMRPTAQNETKLRELLEIAEEENDHG